MSERIGWSVAGNCHSDPVFGSIPLWITPLVLYPTDNPPSIVSFIGGVLVVYQEVASSHLAI